jgi:hypothetical protein
MAMIPTTTARTPSRIIEVDVDLRDWNMTGLPFACLSRTAPSGQPAVRAMPSRHDGRRFRPTSAAYDGIAAG